MRKNEYSFLSLTVLLLLGIVTHWPIMLRVAVIMNSLLVLWQVGARVKEMLHAR